MVIVEGDGGAFGGDDGCGDGRYLNQCHLIPMQAVIHWSVVD